MLYIVVCNWFSAFKMEGVYKNIIEHSYTYLITVRKVQQYYNLIFSSIEAATLLKNIIFFADIPSKPVMHYNSRILRFNYYNYYLSNQACFHMQEFA